MSASTTTSRSSVSADTVYPWESDAYYHGMIELAAEKKQEIIHQVRHSERQVLHSMIGEESALTPWRLKMRKKHVSYYIDPTVPSPLSRFCCVSHTDAPVQELMKLFMVTNTEKLLRNVRVIYRNVKEAKILSVLERPTREHPMRSMYMRYTWIETPKLMRNRDTCLAVTTNVITHPDGSTIGYCLWDSVDVDECPERYESDGIIRGRMCRSGFLFRNSGKPNALTKAIYLIEIAAGGYAPQWTTHFYMSIFGGNVARLCAHFQRKTLDPTQFVSRAQWPSKQRTTFCQACMTMFKVWYRKFHCVSCGEVVCKTCCFKEEVSVQGAGIQRIRVCVVCLQRNAPHQGFLSPFRTKNTTAAASAMERDSTNTIGSQRSVDSAAYYDEVRDLLRRDSFV